MAEAYHVIAEEKASSTAGNTYALLEIAKQIQLMREYFIEKDKEWKGGKSETT